MSRTPAIAGLALLAVGAGIAALAGPLSPGAPASDGFHVTVSEPGAGPRACPPVEVEGLDVRGGCAIRARAKTVAFTVLTPFRTHPLSRCTFDLTLHVAGDGELVADGVEIGDLGGFGSASAYGVSVACGDIRACRRFDRYDRPAGRLPWPGRVADDAGRETIELETCFDTCVGRFEGTLELPLERTAGGWTMGGRRVAPDETGFELSGAWTLAPHGGGNLDIATGRQ